MEQKYWNSSNKKSYPQLDCDIEYDIAIIGGGLAGVMCAERLKDSGMSIAIFEANEICCGETGKSSAMITYAHDLIYSYLTKKHGTKVAKEYYIKNKHAQEYIEYIADTLDCDYRHCDLIYYATTKKGVNLLNAEREIYKSLHQDCPAATNCELPFPVGETMTIPSQGCLNPYAFVTNLCDSLTKHGVTIYEHSRATTTPTDNIIKVNNCSVKAKHFIIATHFPYINIPGLYFIKMYQSRSHNAVYNTHQRLTNMYESAEDNGFEYRPTDNGTLCGGCAIRTGRKKNVNNYSIIDSHMAQKFMTTNADIIAHFSAQDCITFDNLPFIGRYAKSLSNVYVVTGFNKWGFTTSAVAAEIIADIIGGKEVNNIFNPNRLYAIKSPIKEVKNLACIIAGFATRLTVDTKDIATVQVGEGKIIRINGENLGVYRRDDGGIDAIVASCPHMGCALQWNNTDKTWDCPCHGSRFDTCGNIISSPTVKNAEQINIDK